MQITKVGVAFQRVFGALATEAVAACGVIRRQRQFDARSLVATFVLGLLANPQADDRDLAQTAARLGVPVTPQAIRNRICPALAQALEQLFRQAVLQAAGAQGVLAPLCQRFSAVILIDSTTISLPASQRPLFPGCGGREDGHGAAALKLQTELDLVTGAVTHIELEAGKSPDAASVRQSAPRPGGSLRISDLGYFNLQTFAAISQQQAFFLSRVQSDTKLKTRAGQTINLAWLRRQRPGVIDVPVVMGVQRQLPGRLIAFRVPEEQAQKRRQKLRHNSLRKRQREPRAAMLEHCAWTLLVTNAPPELLTVEEVIVLYRARWQVELLFKRWKSLAEVDRLDGRNDTETMIRLWSRLIGALLQHWLTTDCVWKHGAAHSLYRVAQRVRQFANDLIPAVLQPARFPDVLALFHRLTRHDKQNPRRKPGTFQLLNHPQQLDFRLT